MVARGNKDDVGACTAPSNGALPPSTLPLLICGFKGSYSSLSPLTRMRFARGPSAVTSAIAERVSSINSVAPSSCSAAALALSASPDAARLSFLRSCSLLIPCFRSSRRRAALSFSPSLASDSPGPSSPSLVPAPLLCPMEEAGTYGSSLLPS